jgi:hypothetical protein
MARPAEESPENALDALGRVLYERMERLAPGCDEYVEWKDLPQWQRDLHRHGVEAVLDETDLLRLVLPLADDHVIHGRTKERE